MSLDGAFLHIVKNEIAAALPIGARIDKIGQPSRDEVVLAFRVEGQTRRLLLSANASSARVNLTESAQENPPTPSLFCIVLRKHIGNGRLTAITQDGLERVLCFDFVGSNEIGDTVRNRLIIEVMGRVSNIILMNIDSGKIIDAVKRVTDDISKTRLVLPNLPYVPPPRDLTRQCLLDCDVDAVQWACDDKTLIKQLEGVSPIFVREAAYVGVAAFLRQAQAVLRGAEPTVTLVSDHDGNPKDFCFMPVTQYGDEMRTETYDTANALLDSFFDAKSQAQRVKQRSGNIMKTLSNAYERLLRKIENRRLELNECAGKERFRIYGDLINANIYKLSKGDTVLECQDYETGQDVQIELDVRLTPPQNAQKYYAQYRKLTTAEKILQKFLDESAAELAYLDSVIDAASRAVTESEINAIKDEVRAMRGKKPDSTSNNKKKSLKSKPLPPIRFTAADGTEILVGRNNKQNDELTFKTARADDIWLHTKDIAGSHVILRCSGSVASPETLTEAAVIAARHSKGSESGRVPVDYTAVRYVKKPSGSKPGFVIFTHNKTLYVNPKG
ncbi:MAG: NFACT family protein [Oscillospiraceae bacterium]|nr:NFACT family protein [Oscillospiraceae bacterium]